MNFIELLAKSVVKLVFGFGTKCDDSIVAGQELLLAGLHIFDFNAAVGESGYLVLAVDLYFGCCEFLHHNDTGHKLFFKDKIREHFDDAYLVTALKKLESRFNADLSTAANDDLAFDVGLVYENILTSFGLLYAGDRRDKSRSAGGSST